VARVAFVFPGQGSQHEGMGRDLAAACAPARAAFQEIDDALGLSISRLCFEGSAADLALTENTQPALLACSVAAWRCLDEAGVAADFVAGHSLGEYSALVAARVLAAGPAARTVRRRGAYMQEAVPVGQGAMAALLGPTPEAAQELCLAVAREGEVLSPASFNSPGQVVVAGHRTAVERAVEQAAAHGAKRAVLLPVSAPFHCRLMEPAAKRLRVDLAALELGRFRVPLVGNVTAREVTDPEEERLLLERQVTAPVRWQESVERLVALGVDTFVEVGPGKVLAGLVKRMARGAAILPAGTPAEIAAVVEALGGR
jgi:[acyl-carrier-protein] S-malonyltransferase